VRCGVYLVTEDDRRTALLLRDADHESGMSRVSVQIVSTDPGRPAEVAAELRRLVVVHNVFRHQVLSFGGGQMFEYGQTVLRFHHRPRMSADELILPEDTLAAVGRQVVEVARHKDRLLAAGQHLKRGLLLHGPPGVGKTHTVRYLMSRLTGVTVVQVTGDSMHLIGPACSVARALQPAMVVVEDVDLIAEDRGEYPGQHPLLFQLLNEMDGLEEDADVVFVLTTNRADLLEPALAARPGRVDQAVELLLPDPAARRRLFDLYRGGLAVDESNLDEVLRRTEGVTASFLKELLRRSAVLAAARAAADGSGLAGDGAGDAVGDGATDAVGDGATDGATDGVGDGVGDGAGDAAGGRSGGGVGVAPLHVSAADLDDAVAELLDTRNTMTRVLLGAGRHVAGADATVARPGRRPRPGIDRP
jgi:hypothetical protein